MRQLLKTLAVSMCSTVFGICVYHFLFAPRIYTADISPLLDHAKGMVLSGERSQEDFTALIKDLENQINVATSARFQGDRVVLVDKAVFAGGHKLVLRAPFGFNTTKKSGE